ncbi:hypothetical protein Cgig2_005144 [Carnegiea gigantea]|uniref:15-cis-phytoene synthase n=1 Tax=Carnegiea gigantea TaxID=171969 RepID=A0A9Q1KEV4_9CARY|nr:hypothetical protein Cgig2_005144 [Carnegiea gigantea]
MSVALLWVVSPNAEVFSGFSVAESMPRRVWKKQQLKWNSWSLNGRQNKRAGSPVVSSMVANPAGELAVVSAEQMVYNVILKQAALVNRERSDLDVKPDIAFPGTLSLLNEAYDRCGKVCAERTDELVDGPNASHITPTALDRWEARLEGLFSGRPFDMLDAALADTVSKFPIDIQVRYQFQTHEQIAGLLYSNGVKHVGLQPFKDMIEGMRTDLRKSRYKNFDELYLYCYYVAGTVGLMSVPVMGIAPESKATTVSVYNAALALGIANQLTNILRDVGEDARRGRIYLPQDELAQAGLSEEDIFAGKVTDKWRSFMKKQIKRAREFFDQAEKGVTELSADSRLPVWASMLLYRQILDEIEANDYNNFTKRAYVSLPKKLLTLPIAYTKSMVGPSRTPSRLAKA